MPSVSVEIQFYTMSCATCGVHFALELEYRNRKKQTGESWYCPNGHLQVYRETDLDRANRELEQKQKSLNSLHNQLVSKNTTIDLLNKEIRRKDKRAKAGVCPCCNRTFKELANHMKSKHPDFTKPVNELHKKISSK